ncbi:hypothetical protein Q3G72_013566 [Acer saccharum]|nr:hypothetical protein Q3G72_013566 [Acer saccharum]
MGVEVELNVPSGRDMCGENLMGYFKNDVTVGKGSDVDKGEMKASGQSLDQSNIFPGSSTEQPVLSGQAHTSTSAPEIAFVEAQPTNGPKHSQAQDCNLVTKKQRGRGHEDHSEVTIQDSLKMGETTVSNPIADGNNSDMQLVGITESGKLMESVGGFEGDYATISEISGIQERMEMAATMGDVEGTSSLSQTEIDTEISVSRSSPASRTQ